MPKILVKQGDCLASIAAEHGFADLDALWKHPENKELSGLRKSPNILAPGDEVFLPDEEEKKLKIATGKFHRFVIRQPKVQVRIRVLDEEGDIIPADRLTLVVEGREVLLVEEKGGATGPVRARDTKGELTVLDVDQKTVLEVLTLKLGHLDPADTVSGVQHRLHNLGFGGFSQKGELDEATKSAIAAYRLAKGLPEGEIDDTLIQALEVAHEGGR